MTAIFNEEWRYKFDEESANRTEKFYFWQTSKLQSIDQSIINNLKINYRRKIIQ